MISCCRAESIAGAMVLNQTNLISFCEGPLLISTVVVILMRSLLYSAKKKKMADKILPQRVSGTCI